MEIFTEIEIAAPAPEVWRVLTDFSGYSDWNPIMPRISGNAEVGSRIRIWFTAFASVQIPMDAEVVTVDPDRELCWVGPPFSQLRPLVSGRHYFRLQKSGIGMVHLSHGEVFSGFLIPRGFNLGRGMLERAYDRFNRALKDRVERY